MMTPLASSHPQHSFVHSVHTMVAMVALVLQLAAQIDQQMTELPQTSSENMAAQQSLRVVLEWHTGYQAADFALDVTTARFYHLEVVPDLM